MVKQPTSVEKQILQFFVDNPNSIDTTRGIAAWTNLDLKEITPALEEFTKRGFLKAFRTPSTVGYSLVTSKKTLVSIRKILKHK